MQDAPPRGPELGPVRHYAYSLSGDDIFWTKNRKSTRKSVTFDERSKSQDLMKEVQNGILSPTTAASPQSI